MKTNELYLAFFRDVNLLKPYSDNDEYLRDMLAYLDVCLVTVCSAKGLRTEEIPDDTVKRVLRGFTVSPSDVGSVLLSADNESHEDILTESAREQLEQAYYHVECRRRHSAKDGKVFPFDAVCAKFGLNNFERFTMLIALSVTMDRKYESIYAYLHNSNLETMPTKWLAVKLYSFLFENNSLWNGSVIGDTLNLSRYILEEKKEGKSKNNAAEQLILRKRFASYICGINTADISLSPIMQPIKADLSRHIDIRDEKYALASSFFKQKYSAKGTAVLNIYGPDGIGRRYMAAKTAGYFGITVLEVDLLKFVNLWGDKLSQTVDKIYCECILLGAVPCFINEKKEEYSAEDDSYKTDSEYNIKLGIVIRRLVDCFPFVFWVSENKESELTHYKCDFTALEMPMLSASERIVFWKNWGSEYIFSDNTDLQLAANQYILSPRGIKNVLSTASALSAAENAGITPDIIRASVRQHSENQLGRYATLINSVFTWDDLVVSDEQKRQMQMICNQVKYRSIVGEEWGFHKKTPYGRGLCALFYGSPGTGKTMAVQVMANELGLDLYRIDLSQLTSKYIGETQKNISALFRKAKNINAMLFFDEADSMFSKRSEVKDSNDRYANADTAHLLQKLEDYDGITILATNYVNNIDDAFKRRIKFMVNFVFPTSDVRLKLWNKILPKGAKTDESLDFEFFAEQFELSGSNIKEILTNAAYIAASEGNGLRNRHIVEAIKLNFAKYGKILTSNDFGYLGVNDL